MSRKHSNVVTGKRRGVGPIETSTPTKDACLMYASPAELAVKVTAPQPSQPQFEVRNSPKQQASVTVYSPAHPHKRPTAISKPVPSIEECQIRDVSEYILGAASRGITENDVFLYFQGKVTRKIVSAAFDQLQLQFSVYKNGDQFFSM